MALSPNGLKGKAGHLAMNTVDKANYTADIFIQIIFTSTLIFKLITFGVIPFFLLQLKTSSDVENVICTIRDFLFIAGQPSNILQLF